jgi:hypothetical protein
MVEQRAIDRHTIPNLANSSIRYDNACYRPQWFSYASAEFGRVAHEIKSEQCCPRSASPFVASGQFDGPGAKLSLSGTMLRYWRVAMTEFVIEREIPGIGNLSQAELQEVASRSVMILKEMGPQIKWLHSYVTGDKLYCVYMAPDEETVLEHARRGGFPANRVSAVRRLIDPTTAG